MMDVSETFEFAARRGAARIPGLRLLPPGIERHPVPPCGSRTVRLHAGDRFTIVNNEGQQQAEMTFFDRFGRSDASMIGAAGQGRPEATISILASETKSGRQVLKTLTDAGIDLAVGDACSTFGGDSRSGDRASYVAACGGTLILTAPGGPMAPESQDAPTGLTLYVQRETPSPAQRVLLPPEPLADPLLDINIQPGEAKIYEARAGQFIQILDVQGRECSDFQAFAQCQLDVGIEREIDPTATRTVTGMAYPVPGIYSKFYTVDFQPLVEIVQDSCGRHDAFGLACTAKYYEDLGYPGHLNCSDNINEQLGGYDVRARGGWPAINFFYNTMLDDANALGMDDPWSRPGDYVLLRALTDIVCVSTACPCDIDPANGWNPTDVQVRVYAGKESFGYANGYRRSAEADVEMTKQSGFHARFAEHTRNFVEYNGYWLAGDMTAHGAVAEYWGCREHVAIMDLSPLRKYEITGPDAETLLQTCVTRDIRRMAVGQVSYTAICFEHGGMIDDGTVFKLGDMNYRWVGGNDRSGEWMREQAQHRGLDVWVRNSTGQLDNLSVQGPRSRETLRKFVWTAPLQPTIDELGWFRFTVARIGGPAGTACVISRTGYTGELGYEIFCHPKDSAQFFDHVWEAGQEYGIVPLGLEALDMLRIEAGLAFAGQEFCDRTDPFEAGLGFTVPLKSKTEDFIGRGALLHRSSHPQRRLVGLAVEGGNVPSTGTGVFAGPAQVGEVTSGTRSPILGRVIALARVDRSHWQEGTSLELGLMDGRQKRIPVKIVTFPHFDPEKKRVRGQYDLAEQ